jgi:Tfp pilus assembly protein PilF
MLIATFLGEFHGATLWHGDAPDLILMAPSATSSEILHRVRDVYDRPRLHDDFRQLGLENAAGLFGFYLLDDAGLRKFASGARINTDDLTLLEYHAPQSLLAHGLEDKNREAILLHQKAPLPADLPVEDRDDVLASSAGTSIHLQDADGADRFLRGLDNRPETAGIATARGRAALARSDFRIAFHSFDAALAIDPKSIPAAWGRAEVDRRFGNNEKARQEFQLILDRDPKNIQALQSLKQLDTDFSRWPEAEDLQRRIISTDPHSGAAAYAELGAIYLRAGNLDEAQKAMQQSLALDPYNYQAHAGLGQLFTSRKNWAEARQHLEFVKQYFPDEDAAIYPMLFQVDNALGDPRAAAEAVRFGARVFPDDSELQRLKLLL